MAVNKPYKFGAVNWKSDVGRVFYFYKVFPSAYLADRYATRLMFNLKNCPYNVWLIPED